MTRVRVGIPMADAVQKAAHFREKSLGVVSTRRGLAIRVKPQDYAEVAKLARPGAHERLAGKT